MQSLYPYKLRGLPLCFPVSSVWLRIPDTPSWTAPAACPLPALRTAVSSCSRQPLGRKGGGALARYVRPSLAQRARGSPRVRNEEPPPCPRRTPLCLPRRTAGSAPPRGGLRPSEGAPRGEQARSRWPPPRGYWRREVRARTGEPEPRGGGRRQSVGGGGWLGRPDSREVG